MAFALRHHTPVEDDIRRVMTKQLSKAVAALDVVADDPGDAIHECRKRCKKIRGAVRLVRPAVADDGYATVNGLARDAARELAPFRDATATAATVDRLLRSWSGGETTAALERTATTLGKRRHVMERAAAAGHPALERARSLLSDLADAVDDLTLTADGFDAIGGGLAKTYGRGLDALDAAVAAPTGEAFHEWRKRAKYTRYHVRLLSPSAPAVLEPLDDALHALTDALGDAHDLVVLARWLRSDATDVPDLGDTTELRIVVDGLRVELEERAARLGRRLYAESAKRFRKRLGAYWTAWQAEDSRSPAGELELVVT